MFTDIWLIVDGWDLEVRQSSNASQSKGCGGRDANTSQASCRHVYEMFK